MTDRSFFWSNISPNGISVHPGERLNQYGFRGPIVDSNKKILFAGCSFTYGAGVAYHETFAKLTAEKLGQDWSCLNIGIPGSGILEQVASISWALTNFKIDKICWYISDPIRTTVLINNYQKLRFLVNRDFSFLKNDHIKDMNRFIENHLYFERNHLHQLKYSIYTIFSMIKQKNIKCYTTCWIDSFDNEIQDIKDEFNVKSMGNINWLDKGTDDGHPGPKSHAEFADRIIGILENDK